MRDQDESNLVVEDSGIMKCRTGNLILSLSTLSINQGMMISAGNSRLNNLVLSSILQFTQGRLNCTIEVI